MKRKVALAILGVAAVSAISVQGQGFVNFSNYATPYIPITYNGAEVAGGAGAVLTLWAAPGNVGEGALNAIEEANFSGFAGYTDKNQIFTLPGYTTGQTWTLQLRGSGDLGDGPLTGAGPLVVTAAIGDGSVSPPGVAVFNYTPGFELTVVPEPTTFALAGLGAAALLIFRRRD